MTSVRMAVAFGLWVAGCASPIVGAECRVGLEVCDRRCVDTLSDPLHCGGCGIVCEGACVGGVCEAEQDGGRLDGGLRDGDVRDGELLDADRTDAEIPDGGPRDGSVRDGGLRDGDVRDGDTLDGDVPDLDGGPVLRFDGSILVERDAGRGIVDRPFPFPIPTTDAGPTSDASCGECGPLTCCGVTCVDVTSNDAHCGGCDLGCATDERCEVGVCTPRCAEPTEWCVDECVTLQDDPDHCGACGRRCPTGLCVEGRCLGDPAGHVVLVGHSYAESRPAIRQVVANAVWLASGATIDVVFYEGDATSAALGAVDRAIDEHASGRMWRRTVLAEPLSVALADAEVLVVHAQRASSDAELRALGAAWSTDLALFVRRGGILVLLDGEGTHAGTWQILDAAGLLSATSRVSVDAAAVSVVAPGDAVAARLPDRYRAERASVAFVGMSLGATVVAHELGPVVVHRVVGP